MDKSNTLSTPQVPQSHPAKKSLKTLLLATLLVATGLIIGYLIGRSATPHSITDLVPSPKEAVVACTLDAKLCPDGSSVGRVGPNCEFAPCPHEHYRIEENGANEKYTDTKYNFSFEYPSDFILKSPQLEAFYWSNKDAPEGGSPITMGATGLAINASFTPVTYDVNQEYKNLIALKQGEVIRSSGLTKTGEVNKGGVVVTTYFSEPPPNFRGEPAYGYGGVWIKYNMVFRLELISLTKKYLEENKAIFDSMISSLKIQ